MALIAHLQNLDHIFRSENNHDAIAMGHVDTVKRPHPHRIDQMLEISGGNDIRSSDSSLCDVEGIVGILWSQHARLQISPSQGHGFLR